MNNKEISNWLRQAEADLTSSENSLESGDFYVSAFMAQQAVEKSLKALVIKEKGELVKTHNVSKLARIVNIPQNLLTKISQLEPVYAETRYPDISSKLPFEEFDENDARDFLNTAIEVLEWVKKRIS